ncbi:xanthine dehydrogenase family protein molybdopterin-binding subunit [Sulfolobus acidocaldarius]|uniref:Carbon monoxide dehydrogenase n=4 Tax=Sulfolobus acidocaldarius TaxID=2285 RepID=Q4JA14_SULAC|nr:xanthine dehydrogenase family protein molybdopterin-binding subunit [Sulfolobus acidocaldarius]AAY80366.1 carbon monoxide dehydrogenase [Sulfolobus acidocaldarius DSM 639]AGE70949.1 carbon monoxide dehydrogenase [Sulfolobus acidocaldarius N8]AGE73220.1 carbon monoxide dehydrogenase [Sulfolobus acidocaldarius Ron12/I]ALU28746.1 carbon monoxide dehydrogenase [Sulfolobus acidocaldarius]ALU31466.1 carbon monoxide dehydrogenase [Sulfolobus acidocaldarius]
MYVGKPVKRIEDVRLITGKGSYVDDIQIPGTHFVAFLRSQYPHAKIKLKKTDGVFTGNEINPGKDFPIATEEVTYVGQPIAMVIAKDRYEAYDLLENIEVEYEPLDFVTDPEVALKDEIKVYSKSQSNIVYREVFKGGDVEKIFNSAYKVIKGKLYNQRIVASPLETRGALAFYDGGKLTFYSSTQSAHYLRRNLAEFLGFQDIRVIQPDVGGAFGSKIIAHPEEYALAKLSILTRKPLKWIPTRTEEFLSAGHGRDKFLEFETAVDREGNVLGIRGRLVGNLGAPYPDANDDELGNVQSATKMLPGIYKIKGIEIEAIAVNTNVPPTQSYRGAGRPEATYFIERIMNIVADELGIDQYEIRVKNAIDSLPYTNPLGIKYDSGNVKGLLEYGRKFYESLKSQGCVGVSSYTEISGFGPWETARIFIKYDGKITLVTGTGPHGQGDATAFAQIAADILEIPIENIEVRWGDTEIIEDGIGTWGSRTVTIGGSAVVLATQQLKKKLIEVGAKLLKADVEEVEYKQGKVIHKKTGESVDLNRIARKAFSFGESLDVTSVYKVDLPPTTPYGVHLALVDVDETGKVVVKKYVAIDDVGVVINPLLAEGQVIGGALQGLSQGLLEGTVFNDQGQLLTSNFQDYAIPTAVESPDVEWHNVIYGKSSHPTGSKGIGEAGAIAATPAVINAVEQCVKKRILKMPVRFEDLVS